MSPTEYNHSDTFHIVGSINFFTYLFMCCFIYIAYIYIFVPSQERKKAIKEEKRENRKNKIPKHVKKRKEKVAKVSRGTRK